jgi:hypothetical protein
MEGRNRRALMIRSVSSTPGTRLKRANFAVLRCRTVDTRWFPEPTTSPAVFGKFRWTGLAWRSSSLHRGLISETRLSKQPSCSSRGRGCRPSLRNGLSRRALTLLRRPVGRLPHRADYNLAGTSPRPTSRRQDEQHSPSLRKGVRDSGVQVGRLRHEPGRVSPGLARDQECHSPVAGNECRPLLHKCLPSPNRKDQTTC